MFELVEKRQLEYPLLDYDYLEDLVRRCVKVKTGIVNADPSEHGPRRVLNLGHTVGHALEALGKFRELGHGQAVGLGLLCAAAVGKELGVTVGGLQARLRAALLKAGLPVTYVVGKPEKLLDLLGLDKKTEGGKLTMILPRRPGEVEIHEAVPPDLIRRALSAIAP
jgi:3-dehydroquinate synthase